MRTLIFIFAGLLLEFCLLPCAWGAETAAKDARKIERDADSDGWSPLFNGRNLDGWDTILRSTGRNNDPDHVFQVHDNLIHIYKDQTAGEPVTLGYLLTQADYSHYQLRFEYRWGEKKFAPRTKTVRDAGCLYHASNEGIVWPRSIECQVQEGDTGDCWVVHGAQIDTTVDPKSGGETPFRYLPADEGGVLKTIADESVIRVIKQGTFENPGWNRVEVIVRGSQSAEHIINGHTVFKCENLRTMATDDKPSKPLTHGRILLQAEFAEVQYRNIEIRPVASGPLQVGQPAQN